MAKLIQAVAVLFDMQAVILFFTQYGSAVKLPPGIGTFTPTVGSDGRIRVSQPVAPWERRRRQPTGTDRRRQPLEAKYGEPAQERVARCPPAGTAATTLAAQSAARSAA
jgi:hypothetical protein